MLIIKPETAPLIIKQLINNNTKIDELLKGRVEGEDVEQIEKLNRLGSLLQDFENRPNQNVTVYFSGGTPDNEGQPREYSFTIEYLEGNAIHGSLYNHSLDADQPNWSRNT